MTIPFIQFSKGFVVRFFSTLKDPTTDKYAYYYVALLVVVSITVLLMSFGIIELFSIEGSAVFVEGFVGLYMLSRHHKTENKFFRIFMKGLKMNK